MKTGLRMFLDGRRFALGIGFLALAAIVLAGCTKGTYQVDIFPEMHYNQSTKIGEPPRLDVPEGAVPVTGPQTHVIPPDLMEAAKAFKNPLPAGAATNAKGAELYRVNCAMCHGVQGKGNGKVGDILVRDKYVRPPDLTAAVTQGKTDGELFTTLTNGVNVMPKFGYLLTDEERWAVIAYLRALPR